MDLVHSLSDRLLFAVPKKGRLHESCLSLLSGSDIQFHRNSRLDIALVKNHPIALVFLPAADIPTFVGEGRVDLGITGRDQVAEHYDRRDRSRDVTGGARMRRNTIDGREMVVEEGVEEVLDLGFGGCKLQVQVPEGESEDPKSLVGKTIVTSYTNLSEDYFRGLEEEIESGTAKVGAKTNGTAGGSDGAAGTGSSTPAKRELRTRIKFVSGSVEAACALGLADAVVDLVESGETMRAAGLKAIDTVLESKAVLIRSKRPRDMQLVELIASRISGVITAQRFVLCTYNIERSKIDQAKRVTPGKRAPTVTSLEASDWVAINVMIERSKMATTMDEIMNIGGTDILITKIDNSRATS